MSKILFDTNAYSYLLSGNESAYASFSNAEIIYMTPIVIGELLFGFKNGKKYK